METIEPAYGTATLLIIAVGAVLLLLTLILRFRVHAFVALVLVSLLTALVTRIPFADVVPTLLQGFGSTLATVALLVGFGAMIGRILEVTGGAQVLAVQFHGLGENADEAVQPAVFGDVNARNDLPVASVWPAEKIVEIDRERRATIGRGFMAQDTQEHLRHRRGVVMFEWPYL